MPAGGDLVLQQQEAYQSFAPSKIEWQELRQLRTLQSNTKISLQLGHLGMHLNSHAHDEDLEIVCGVLLLHWELQ